MENFLKREKSKSIIFKQELMNTVSEIKDQNIQLQNNVNNSNESNINKNKQVLNKILNSEEDLFEVKDTNNQIKKESGNGNFTKTKYDVQSLNTEEPVDLSAKKISKSKENLQLSDNKDKNIEYKCNYVGCVRTFKSEDELIKHVSRRHKGE